MPCLCEACAGLAAEDMQVTKMPPTRHPGRGLMRFVGEGGFATESTEGAEGEKREGERGLGGLAEDSYAPLGLKAK